jgi:hypothetical protein
LTPVGVGVGVALMLGLGLGLGVILGLILGVILGLMLGVILGLILGVILGLILGVILGLMLGLILGLILGVILGLILGLVVGLILGLVVGLMLMVGLVEAHPVGALIVSSMRLTPPVLASSRPLMVAVESTEIDAEARMLPANSDPVSIVAELPTCQKTSQAVAPLMRLKSVAMTEPAVSAEGTWKTKTGSVWFSPLRVIRPPFTRRLDEAW